MCKIGNKRNKICSGLVSPALFFYLVLGSSIREPGSEKGEKIRISDPGAGINAQSRIHPARGMNPDPERLVSAQNAETNVPMVRRGIFCFIFIFF
jgi:hypothetical protein